MIAAAAFRTLQATSTAICVVHNPLKGSVEGLTTVSGSRAGLAARPAPSEPYVQVSPHTAQASASASEVDRGDRPGRHQRWTRTRVVSPVAGSRRTTMLVLPPCSRSGSKTALQAAPRPRLSTLENQLFSTNPSDEMLY